MSARKALLVVEDEPLVRSMIEEVLLDEGYVVHPAESGSRAIELMSTIGCTIDGVVTDIRLGAGPDGWMVARHLREQCPGLPVIYVTGDSAHEWRAEGVSESRLIQKPFVMAQITDAVAHLLN
jgi:CheY-like chemotaxis protein